MLREGEVTGEAELRGDRQVQHGVLQAVLVLTVAILVDGCGVTQLPVVVLVVGQRLGEV